MNLFQLVSTLKVNLVGKMKRITYVLFYTSSTKKITNSGRFYLISNFW